MANQAENKPTRSRKSKLVAGVGVFAAILLAFIFLSLKINVYVTKIVVPRGDFGGHDNHVYWHTTIAGTEFWLPDSYDLNRSPPRRISDDITLTATFPDFGPDIDRALPARGDFQRQIRILFGDPKLYRPIADSVERSLGFSHATVNSGQEFGYTHWTQPADHRGAIDEFWVAYDNNKATAIIRCSPANEGTHPQCRYDFESNGFHYWLGYARTQLPHSKEIATKAIALIESFKIKPTE